MDSHTISTLNRLEVVDTGRRRRWSEEEGADCFGKPIRAAPGCGDSAAIRLITFSAGDLAKSLRSEPNQIRGWVCQGSYGRGRARGVGGGLIGERDRTFDEASD